MLLLVVCTTLTTGRHTVLLVIASPWRLSRHHHDDYPSQQWQLSRQYTDGILLSSTFCLSRLAYKYVREPCQFGISDNKAWLYGCWSVQWYCHLAWLSVCHWYELVQYDTGPQLLDPVFLVYKPASELLGSCHPYVWWQRFVPRPRVRRQQK